MIWILWGMIMLVLFLRARINHQRVSALFFKVATSIGFFGWACWLAFQHPSSMAILILVALFCGVFGDMWLGMKWTYPKQDHPYTFAGFISFAIEHFFLICFLLRQYGHPMLLLVILLVAMGLSYAIVGMEKTMHLRYGIFKGISLIYGTVLFAVPLFSLTLMVGYQQDATLTLLLGGTLCFVFSDLILSRTYFGTNNDRPIDIIVNHVLYYLAQFLIAAILL
ncbi:lysoplasmalogenase family protein [Absicoccus intestinalis]|uniref:Lysoplasmalogenase n=1 Tax=Absicoccus intestinalis TaxID=2926319 RepID=A0ABU4WPJ7_9FIRM|nr:lysoplasmalogenase family protein [Absicoccus sp. CLA-KB-P134]MDX8417971.1 lysoplasmalogenase [Absicoccus sp. CLA-KB-P134]